MTKYLEVRREELRKRHDKGFTLMEMLIVVAIIAVLIAIAIPIFTSQLEKARDATSVANIRSAYAEAQTAYITKDTSTSANATYAAGTGGEATVTVKNVDIESQVANNWSEEGSKLPFYDVLGGGGDNHGDAAQQKKDCTLTFTYNADGQITSVTIA